MKNRIVIFCAILALSPAIGCRTASRAIGTAIGNQGSAEVNYEQSADKTLFRYFTSENSQARIAGLKLQVDEKGNIKSLEVEEVVVIRTPSESQALFAGQIAAAGKADAQAIAGYGSIAGTVTAAAVKAGIEAVAPVKIARINADKEVSLSEINANKEVALLAPPEHE